MPQAKLGEVMLRHDLRGLQRSLVIASGDKDVLPLANVAHQLGWIVEMAAFESATATEHAPNWFVRLLNAVLRQLIFRKRANREKSG
jgi:hypothetical protein